MIANATKIALIVGIFFSFVFMSDSVKQSRKESFYQEHLNNLISNYKNRQTRLFADSSNSGSENGLKASAVLSNKAVFFEANKEELVREMIAGNVGVDPSRIGFFLHKEYSRFNDLPITYAQNLN